MMQPNPVRRVLCREKGCIESENWVGTNFYVLVVTQEHLPFAEK
jgi:hypothetical protein